ncbi:MULTISPECIES: TAXI family TRAP transporter solute-binding subunit [Clostridia]|uniref:TAXI family TRAP transporter solute-binding subunit n=1 Tax=Clostridia TaxID=186801 RepID=UPI000EA36D4D|nr:MULTISPECIES: TAXI family TRAP transporter solute-binding subunit [Clostridia]NBJ70250.1 TAXI family TRAP transporter solute-binding subunit [Roseburia sp. 1XD42-34]RKI76699.1 TAXI family TRAP transporter solute-binding subunit [Clostridium sp. 1xD42-85]
MKRANQWWLIVLLFLFVFLLSACGGDKEADGADEGDKGKAEKPEFLSLLTGGTSGTYYPLGGEMATIIKDETGIQTDPQSSNASADNVAALRDGDAQLAFVQTDVISNAIEGINSFEGEPVENVQAIGSLYPETIQIVTTKDSGITSVEDLAGKAVSVGAPGSGTYVNAEQILEIHGMTMDDIEAQNLDFGESTGGIQDGNIDAAFITAGTPTGAVEGLQAQVDVNIVPIAQEKIDALVEKYPYYASDTVPAGTYKLEEDVQTVAVLAMLAVTDSLSEDVVYDITKAIYENSDKIAHDKGQFITKDTALDGIGVDLHPGAKKYFDEEGISASE